MDSRLAAADEEHACASDESWADITAARLTLMELEGLKHRLQEDFIKRLLSSICGIALIIFASYVLSHFEYDQSSIAVALICLGLFIAGTAISQLFTARWAFKESEQLRIRLLKAVQEASEEYERDSSLVRRG